MAGILSNQFKLIKLLGNVSAGQDVSAQASTAVDARGFDRAMFTLFLGAVATGGKLAMSIQECDTSNGQFADIDDADIGSGGKVLTGKSDNEIIIDVPVREGFLKVAYQRTAANVEFDALTCMLYNPKKLPVDASSTLAEEVIV